MSHTPPRSPRFASLLATWGPAAIVFVMFFAYSAVQAPVPGVNEPQYLGKAKHFWDPTWAAGDFFLDSSNPHLVFYVAVGWLTRLASLEATAWIARIVGYALLATGWTMLAGRVAGSRWAAAPAAAIFLLVASIGNLSGEWLVGGIEGKTFAYGLLCAAIALWLDGRAVGAAACLGGAVSFHPIVGAWGLAGGLTAEALCRGDRSKFVGGRRWGAVLPVAVFLVAAMPGLIPAVLTLEGGSPGDVARANYIQVFIRLRHHLDPTQFSIERYAGYAAMLVVWSILWMAFPVRSGWPDSPSRDARHGVSGYAGRWFAAFVLTSVAVALTGVAIGWHDGSAWDMPLRNVRTTILKFYPFRLADVFVPLALSMAVARVLVGRRESRETASKPRLIATGLLALVAYAMSLAIGSPDRNPSRMPPDRLAAWIDAAQWISANTPDDAVIVAPSRQWGFRWFSGRALYVNFKDAPQDAAGLLEWERRLDVTRRWWESSRTGRFSQADLRRLGDETQAGYLVTLATSLRFEAEPLHDNGAYRVYALQ